MARPNQGLSRFILSTTSASGIRQVPTESFHSRIGGSLRVFSSSRVAASSSQPDESGSSKNQYPDRPAPPEARPIVEPAENGSSEASEAGQGRDGYVSLMQQIVGAVRARPTDPAAQSKLQEVRSRLEEQQLRRVDKAGTVTVGQLRAILTVSARSVGTSEEIQSLADKYSVDAKLLKQVLASVRLPEERPLRDGEALLGL